MNNGEILLRFGLSVIIGGLIGYERESQNRPAGFITHILVCVGASIISMIQLQLIQDSIKTILEYPQLSSALKVDNGRVIAQVVSGIGFLGAGTIIHQKGSVKGLTTAATLWVVACIGLAIGLGYYFLSIISGIGVYCVLVVLKRIKFKIQDKKNKIKIQIKCNDVKEMMQKATAYCKKNNIRITNIEFLKSGKGSKSSKCLYTVLTPSYINQEKIIDEINQNDKFKVKIV